MFHLIIRVDTAEASLINTMSLGLPLLFVHSETRYLWGRNGLWEAFFTRFHPAVVLHYKTSSILLISWLMLLLLLIPVRSFQQHSELLVDCNIYLPTIVVYRRITSLYTTRWVAPAKSTSQVRACREALTFLLTVAIVPLPQALPHSLGGLPPRNTGQLLRPFRPTRVPFSDAPFSDCNWQPHGT